MRERTSDRQSRIRTLRSLACAAAVILAPYTPAQAQAPEQNRFTRTVLADGLDEPMQLEFDRAGRVYFIERKGARERYDEATGQLSILGRIPVAQDTAPLAHSAPEAQGISSAVIRSFVHAADSGVDAIDAMTSRIHCSRKKRQ